MVGYFDPSPWIPDKKPKPESDEWPAHQKQALTDAQAGILNYYDALLGKIDEELERSRAIKEKWGKQA